MNRIPFPARTRTVALAAALAAAFLASEPAHAGSVRYQVQELATADSGYAPHSVAMDINDEGQVVGYVATGDETTRRAALWDTNGQVRLLDIDNARFSEAQAINNDGLIVGSVIGANGYPHAAVWRYGQLTDLDATTLRNDAFSSATGVNNWGEIIGTDTVGDLADHRFVPILIQNGQVTRLLADDTEGWFTKINNASQAIGTVGYNGAFVWSPSGGALDVNSRLQTGSPGVTWLSSLNELGQMTAYTTNHKAAVRTPTGTLNWTGPSGGFFNDAASWDSGLGLAPNKFLDSSIATTVGMREVIGVSYELDVKSLSVGGGGGTSRLILIEGGRINALEGTRLLPGGRLTVAAGSDAIYATGHLGGNLRMGTGSGIELKAGRPEGGSFDRLVIDGGFQIDGGEFVLDMFGAPEPQLGDSYDLLDWGSQSGSFGELLLPQLSAGLRWDTSRLYVDGVLSVTAVPEPGSWALLLGSGVALARRQRRRS